MNYNRYVKNSESDQGLRMVNHNEESFAGRHVAAEDGS